MSLIEKLKYFLTYLCHLGEKNFYFHLLKMQRCLKYFQSKNIIVQLCLKAKNAEKFVKLFFWDFGNCSFVGDTEIVLGFVFVTNYA